MKLRKQKSPTELIDTAEKPKRRRRWIRWTAAVFAVAFAILVDDYCCYPYGSFTNAPTANRGENGLWLRYTWYFGEKSSGEVDLLANRLVENQIRYAFFHARFIQKDGSLKFRYPEQARKLTDALHKQAPGVKLLAYCYAASRATCNCWKRRGPRYRPENCYRSRRRSGIRPRLGVSDGARTTMRRWRSGVTRLR